MRRGVVSMAVTVLIVLGFAGGLEPLFAAGESFPEKDITFVVQYAPGGGWDSYARALAPYLEKYLPNKVNVIIDNKPGAGGRVGNSYVYRSRPDGYTIGFVSIPGAIVTAMFTKAEYDLAKVKWVHTVGNDPIVMFVKGDSRISSFNDLRALAEKRSVKECVTGLGDSIDVITVVTLTKLNFKYETISGYKGSLDATVGLMRGDGDFIVLPGSGFALKYVANRDLKPILSISEKRTELYPNVPSVGELGVSPVPEWLRCVFAPPGTPKEPVKILDDAFAKALKDPGLLAWAKKSEQVIYALNGQQTSVEIMKSIDLFLKMKDVLTKHLTPH
jgi:tripartite-type tricarboxylate transporter receptor subunit TctC